MSFTGVELSSLEASFSTPLAFSPLSSNPGLKTNVAVKPCAFTASSACTVQTFQPGLSSTVHGLYMWPSRWTHMFLQGEQSWMQLFKLLAL